MPKFTVACSWTMIGEFKDVEADTLEEAIRKVEDNDNNAFPISRADGEYLDDSFEINDEVTKELNKPRN